MSEPPFSVTGRWSGAWSDAGLRDFAIGLREQLGERPVTFALVFTTPAFFDHSAELLEIVRLHARAPVVAGCSSYGLIAGAQEFEEGEGVVVALYALPPGAGVRAYYVPAGEGDGVARARAQGCEAAGVSGWLALLEPFRTDPEAWLEGWQSAFPGAPIYGGLAAGRPNEPRARIYCNGEVHEEGGVVLAFSGVRVLGAVAQGCTPVGETWTITRVEGNIVHRIGNRPAYAVLEETFQDLSDDLKQRSRGGFFAGLVVDEYREEHERGDFLVRSLLGGDPNSGALALGALPRTGQTLQFQLRDAEAAREDLRTSLMRLRDRLGRAQALFGRPDHDAGLVRDIFGEGAQVAGFFCNGEFGPVGGRSFLHSYTAALVMFVGPPRSREDEL